MNIYDLKNSNISKSINILYIFIIHNEYVIVYIIVSPTFCYGGPQIYSLLGKRPITKISTIVLMKIMYVKRQSLISPIFNFKILEFLINLLIKLFSNFCKDIFIVLSLLIATQYWVATHRLGNTGLHK